MAQDFPEDNYDYKRHRGRRASEAATARSTKESKSAEETLKKATEKQP
jgi:hypothetical protein